MADIINWHAVNKVLTCPAHEDLSRIRNMPVFNNGHDDLRYTTNSTCRECQRIRSLHYGRKNIGRIIENFNIRTYGVTSKEIDSLTDKQNNKCAICSIEFNGSKNQKHLDHCHKTNRIRGLLCSNCNTALGLFKDDANRLSLAINYLKNSMV